MKLQVVCQSKSGTDYTGAIAQNAGANANLQLPEVAYRGGSIFWITGFSILSVQALDWELWAFSRNTFQTTIDADSFRGYWAFTGSHAEQIAATGLYYYYVDGLYIPYADQDGNGQLHLSLVNRNVTSKIAGASGAIVVKTYGVVEQAG